jgi:hypothetical protein
MIDDSFAFKKGNALIPRHNGNLLLRGLYEIALEQPFAVLGRKPDMNQHELPMPRRSGQL